VPLVCGARVRFELVSGFDPKRTWTCSSRAGKSTSKKVAKQSLAQTEGGPAEATAPFSQSRRASRSFAADPRVSGSISAWATSPS
jgi:hypothetical protein